MRRFILLTALLAACGKSSTNPSETGDAATAWPVDWSAPSGAGSYDADAADALGVVPEGVADVYVEVEGDGVDLTLTGADDWVGAGGYIDSPVPQATNVDGLGVVHSGTDGLDGVDGHETIHVLGRSTVPLLFGIQPTEGPVTVTYSWGQPAPRRPLPPPTELTSPGRVVAFGDVHGDLGALKRVLRLVGAIDTTDTWIGGNLVVVQVGDQTDRGDDERAILDLLETLADQAYAAGGGVYPLLGNHEVMNVDLDFRYVTDGGWQDFDDIPYDESDPLIAGTPERERGRVAAFRPGGPYATLLAGHNVLMRVDDTLFVHGGILPDHVDFGLERINQNTQQWMHGLRENKPNVLSGDDAPIWSRHYSDDPSSADCDLLASVLESTGAARMVVAHTVQDEVNATCGGQVWRVDVGMAAYYGGVPQAIEIRDGQVTPIQ